MRNTKLDRKSLISTSEKIYAATPIKGLSRYTLELIKAYNKQSLQNANLPKYIANQLHKISLADKVDLLPFCFFYNAKPIAQLIKEWLRW